MKVSELRDELQSRGLSTKGLKKELLERFNQTIQNEPVISTSNIQNEDEINIVAQENNQSELQSTFEISNLVRSFSYNQLIDLLSTYGTVQGFWINSIKSRCFVHFDNTEHSKLAKDSLNDLVWPKNIGKELHISFLPYSKCIQYIEQEHSKTGTGYQIGFKEANFPESLISELERDQTKDSQSTSIQDKLSMSLNEIFKMTKTEPSVYYLPADSKNNTQETHTDKQYERSEKQSHSHNLHRSYHKRKDHGHYRSQRSRYDGRYP